MLVGAPLAHLVVTACPTLVFLLILAWLGITVGFLLLASLVLGQHRVDRSFVNPRVEGLLAGVLKAIFVLLERDAELLGLIHTPAVQESIIADRRGVLCAERHRHRLEHSVGQAIRLAPVIEVVDLEVLGGLLSALSSRSFVGRILVAVFRLLGAEVGAIVVIGVV